MIENISCYRLKLLGYCFDERGFMYPSGKYELINQRKFTLNYLFDDVMYQWTASRTPFSATNSSQSTPPQCFKMCRAASKSCSFFCKLSRCCFVANVSPTIISNRSASNSMTHSCVKTLKGPVGPVNKQWSTAC